MSLSGTRVPAISVLLALLMGFPGTARADQAVAPLGEMARDTDFIVIGVVSAVTSGPSPGDFVVAVEVEDAIKGTGLARFTLPGNDGNEESLQRFQPGTRLLLFLVVEGGLIQIPPRFGEGAINPVEENTIDDSREIVARVLGLGDRLRLSDVLDLLQKDSDTPPGLLGSLLEELSLRLTPSDRPLLGEIACDPGGSFLPAVQLWAISRVGAHEVAQARSCLESMVPIVNPRTLSLASAEALGELGDQASVPALVSLLQSLPSDPMLFPDRRGDSTAATGKEDPEDETEPAADPDERSERGETEVTPPPTRPTEPDGEREPDGAPRQDGPNRGADGGLAEAAILALGKIGDPAAVPLLFKIAREGDDLALHSSVVHALGLIGGTTVQFPLLVLSIIHPNPLIREQAKQTLARPRRAARGM